MKKIKFILILFGLIYSTDVPFGAFSITRIHYDGGGDWYSDPSSLPNLLNFVQEETTIILNPTEKQAKIGDDIFTGSSYLYLTGHGNISFSKDEVFSLRKHLKAGAFLHADDNYGMDISFREQIKKVFPDKDWVELPPNHEIFNNYFNFENGLPKVHEHNNKRPQALALFDKEKMIVLYTYESDLGDGWEDSEVHQDGELIRKEALKMGTNIIIYALTR
ncbi:MAG: hypothetical protein CMF96_00285 [Candidatus Marinimicrobia bacterium]|nr:hypothetical protein [Candidatus Neomarinimicrobiota bacterium]|tara:strand:- start:707 stop:1363 length:657 start_codon:yes stop_codon:yes gene_type:complete